MGQKRILVVDDSLLVLQIVRDLIEAIPNTLVSTETSGAGALARMDGREIWDLVLLDIEMPDIGGLEVLEALKLKGRKEPVVAFSADDTPQRRVRLAELGVATVLTKPVDAATLTALVSGTPGSEGPLVPPSLDPPRWPGSVPFGPTIQRFNGNLELYRKSLARFDEEYGVWVTASLDQGFPTAKDFRFFLHTLKGVAGYLGSREIVQAIEELQTETGEPSRTRLQSALARFLGEAGFFLGGPSPPVSPTRSPGVVQEKAPFLNHVRELVSCHDSEALDLPVVPPTSPSLDEEELLVWEELRALVQDYEFETARPLAELLAPQGPFERRESNRPTLLVVDDQTVNIDILREALKNEYRILVAKSGEGSLRVAAAEAPDLMLLDVVMPGLSGLETCRALKAGETTRAIPVIFVTAQDSPVDEELGFRAGAVDYIHKPAHPHIIRVRVKIHLQLSDQTRALEHLVAERTQEILAIQHEVVNRLSIASEYKDTETGLHIHRIGRYAVVLAGALGIPAALWDEYRDAASLHDIGKIGIPDSVLLKPGKLDEAEWEIMKSHTTIGARMLADLPQNLFKLSAASALSHHERWDGSGYPQGLSGKAIPLVGRIVAVCDVFDALLSDRPYKKAWTLEDTLAHLTQGRGTHFDPEVVDAFFRCLDALVAISRER